MSFILLILLSVQGLKANADLCEESWRRTSAYARDIAEGHGRELISKGLKIDFDRSELKILSSAIHHPDHKIGILNGEKVYLKPIVLRRFRMWPPPFFWYESFDEGQGPRELTIYLAFNDLKIPTLFKGVVMDKKGNSYMALQFKEGRFIRWCVKSEAPYITEQACLQMEEIKAMFLKYGIVPSDLQAIISRDGFAYLIDVQNFQFMGTDSGEGQEHLKGLLDMYFALFSRLQDVSISE